MTSLLVEVVHSFNLSQAVAPRCLVALDATAIGRAVVEGAVRSTNGHVHHEVELIKIVQHYVTRLLRTLYNAKSCTRMYVYVRLV